MRIILWSLLNRSLRSLRFGLGMLRIILLLDCVLRASVAPQGFALASSPRDGFFACGGSNRGDDHLGAVKSIIGIIPPLSAFLLERGIPLRHPSQAHGRS